MGTFTTLGYEAVDIQPGVDAMTNVVNGLASTVQGLDENDWVSVTASFIQSPESNVTVRAKPNQPDSLEVWVDGKRQ